MIDAHYRPYGRRAKIGLIVPTTNTVNEAEWARLAPEGVSIHVTRMVLHTGGGGDAAALERDLAAAIATLTPASVDVIAYGCTAGSMVSPLDKLTNRMRELGGVPVAVIGQAFPYTPIANPRHMVADWKFGIQEERLQKQVNEARAKGAHVVVQSAP